MRTRAEIEREFIELTSALGEAGAVPSLGVGDGILLRLLLDIRDLLTKKEDNNN